MADRPYQLNDLIELMHRLRDREDGCPWDIQQTYRSIVPHTLEEVYEVIDCIEREDYAHLAEELGDLLFQVVFYAQIASEEDRFDLSVIIDQLVAKLLYRHPHVFPAGTLDSRRTETTLSSTQVNAQWDALKQKEKQDKGQTSAVLADVPLALPGLLRAKKIQKKAAKVGFDWPDSSGVIAKIKEELAELEQAIANGDVDDIEGEMGDVLFSMAHLSNHLKIDPEQALRRTNRKFERRFSYIETQVNNQGGDWQRFSLEQLDGYWNQAKKMESEHDDV